MSDSKVLCYVKRQPRFLFPENAAPHLLYVARMRSSEQVHPRILHAHQDLTEILLICGGKGRYLVGETAYDVRPGDLLIYNSGVVHDEICSQDDAVNSYCLAMNSLRMPGLRENALIPDSAPVLYHTGSEAEDLQLIFDMMYRYLDEDRPGCEALCHHLFIALLNRILQLIGEPLPRPAAETEPQALGRRVQEYIDQHYSEPLTLQAIGEALHLSPFYLSHVFKETSGYSPTQYLLRRRIGEAQNLLIYTDLPVARIAEQVGFETQNYFNQQFSKHVGMPPRKFRQTYVGEQLKTPPKQGSGGDAFKK